MNVDKRKPTPAEDTYINALSRMRILKALGRMSTAELYVLAKLANRLDGGVWMTVEALQGDLMEAVIEATTSTIDHPMGEG